MGMDQLGSTNVRWFTYRTSSRYNKALKIFSACDEQPVGVLLLLETAVALHTSDLLAAASQSSVLHHLVRSLDVLQ